MTERLSTWRLTGRMSRYRLGLFVLSLVLLMAMDGSTLLIGWALKLVFDALGGAATELGIYHLIAVLAAAEASKIGIIWANVVRSRCWEQMRSLLRLNLIRAQLASGGPQAGPPVTSPGEAVSRFRDDVDDFLDFLSTVISAAGKVALVLGSLIIMTTIEPMLVLAVVVPLILIVVVTRLVSRRIRAHRAAYRRASAAVTGLLGDLFGGVLAVKTAQAEAGVLARLRDHNERRRRTGLRDELVTRLLSRFVHVTMDLSLGVVLLLAVPAARRGDFTVGELALFVSYLGTLVWAPVYAGRVLAKHRQAGVSIERMAALLPAGEPAALTVHRPLRDPESLASTAPDLGPLSCLTLRGVTATYPASTRGIHGIDLTVDRGSFTVITGPAGAGKTTLLRAVLGLLPLRAGTMSWNGADVTDPAEFFVPPRSAYVPQVPRLFSESLRENLLLGADHESGLSRAVHTAVLDQDVTSMPAGLDTEVGARGVRLSGGQAQRAAIARALARPADLLVLDDVSSALDVETERRLWDRLLAEPGRTLLVVSNRPATIARADQVVTLDHGRVVSATLTQETAA
ncbi:ATP-binding cassette domain-containing protein [Kribbella sp. CA-247076]|uniref:ATP-binding cassette domain-containing protein n=1 Tax=Kribbella sp. CA-247076 TaxID=3239941 RepID=UPI003D8D2261